MIRQSNPSAFLIPQIVCLGDARVFSLAEAKSLLPEVQKLTKRAA